MEFISSLLEYRERRSKTLERGLQKTEAERIINGDGLGMLWDKSLKLSGEFYINKDIFVKINATAPKVGVLDTKALADFLTENFGLHAHIRIYTEDKEFGFGKGSIYLDFKYRSGIGKVIRRATLRGECYMEDLYRKCPSFEIIKELIAQRKGSLVGDTS